jgi:GNAT superfamily N-acetyltransferase
MQIRKILKSEMEYALKLIWDVFMEFEAPDYTEEGIEEFRKSLKNDYWLDDKLFYGAYESNKLLGVIATIENDHISLFFVDSKYHNKGIGRMLLEYVESINKSGFLSVNSSPYAHEIYKHFGFVDIDKEKIFNGIKTFLMIKELRK